MDPSDIMKNDRSHKYDSQSKERHIPSIEVLKNYGNSGKDYIHVVVGENVKHPNSLQHQIQWIELYARTKMQNTIQIGRVNFAPGTSPDALFRLIYFGKYREFCALAYCNVHGLWQNCIEIREELRLTADAVEKNVCRKDSESKI